MYGHGYGHGCDYGCGYGYQAPTYGYGRNFALIVVLFILLVIIGASWTVR